VTVERNGTPIGIVKGGHAIMLAVELPSRLSTIASTWANRSPANRSVVENPHMTLLYVGRNLPKIVGDVMLEVAERMIGDIPRSLTLTGAYDIFGFGRCMVATIEQSDQLSHARSSIAESILWGVGDEHQILDEKFGFNPHVTLVKSRAKERLRNPANVVSRKMRVTGVVVKIGATIHTLEIKG
jgi:2'-5' RNA ligase